MPKYRDAVLTQYPSLRWPTRKDEDWKYVPLELVLDREFTRATVAEAKRVSVAPSSFFSETNRIVLVNGFFSEWLSHIEDKNLHVSTISRSGDQEGNAFSALNAFEVKDATYIQVEQSQIAQRPLHIILAMTDEKLSSTVSYPRVILDVAKNAQAEIFVTRSCHNTQAHLVNAVFEARVGENAQLKFLSVQEDTAAAYEFFTMRFKQQRNSRVESLFLTLSGALVRNNVSATFMGENADAKLKGLSFIGEHSQVFNCLVADHQVGHCNSEQLYRNVLFGDAKAEFNSHVKVVRQAQKSVSNQLSRNLLLSKTAQCWARPQLRIDADDVSCVHGATVGQLEQQELFYLRSRGLDQNEARYLLTYGFMKEVIDGIFYDPLRFEIERKIKLKLKAL